jgi:hypothetical protein
MESIDTEIINLENIFVTEGLPKYTYVQPPNFNDIYIDFRHFSKPVVIEGASGTGKTSIVLKILERINKKNEYIYYTARKQADLINIVRLAREPIPGRYVIDDFHRVPEPIRKRLADFAKVAADDGANTEYPKLIFVGINQIGEDLLQLSPDIAKRCGIHKVASGDAEDIKQLVSKGEKSLNIKISNVSAIFKETKGDYWLTQLMCKACCIQNAILESQLEKKTIKANIKEIRASVITRLKSSYNNIIKEFCRGIRFRPSNNPYIKLLEIVSIQTEMPIDLNELANTSTEEYKAAINNIKDHRLKVHIDSKHILANNFFYNESTKNFNIEDPALHYYIKHLDWKVLYKECGFKKSSRSYQFDIALSFAGENRELASHIANLLRASDVEVFYDEYYEANYLGKAWTEQFKNIFANDSRTVLCILDKNHQQKIWPTFERECFSDRVKDHEIIPIFLDDTAFVGIPKDIIGIKMKIDYMENSWREKVEKEIIPKLLFRLD